MSSVTARVKQIKQPYGGYVKLSEFAKFQFEDEWILNENENIHASLIGMTVDYMSRLLMGQDILDVFKISIMGASIAQSLKHDNSVEVINKLLNNIKGLDDQSIISSCKIVTYDVWFRNIRDAMMAKSSDQINPNADTIENIRILIERSIKFLKKCGPILKYGVTFEPNGYTRMVNSGDGDFITQDTIWDFKVSKAKPTSRNTLQLLMYWIMGKHSGQKIFEGIQNVGMFNPRLNVEYILDMSNVPKDTIQEIEEKIICY